MHLTTDTEGTTMATYTGLTDDQRAAWDAIVSECADCAAVDGDDPCDAHDLGGLDDDALDGMIAAWRQEG